MSPDRLELVSSLVGLSSAEKDSITAVAEEYEDSVDSLVAAYQEYSQLLKRKLEIDSRYASLNYKLYESFMEVHKNAIIISALRSEVQIKKLELGGEAEDRIAHILKKYLIIEKFY